MALTINTNIGSINGQRNLEKSGAALSGAMSRLSSGVRVNTAKDDAAGMAISNRMTSQIRGMTVAVRNANDGISLTQTAEGALGSLTDTLQRMRDLAVQSSSNAGVSAADRAKMETEFKALNNELGRIIENTEFNGKKILGGDLANGLNVQVGASTDSNSRIGVAVANMTAMLSPVTKSTLSPLTAAIDSTLAANVAANAINVADGGSANTNLKAANDAAILANKAVVAANAASAAPNDTALAKASAAANLAAAAAVNASAIVTATSTAANKDAILVTDAFKAAVDSDAAIALASVTATTDTNTAVLAATVTNANQAAALLTTANQLAAASKQNINSSGQNLLASTMFTLTADTLIAPAITANAITKNLTTLNVLNDAVNRAINSFNGFGADRDAQKTLATLQIAKSIAGASYVQDPLKTAAANDAAKAAYIANSGIVVSNTEKADAIAADYGLQAINNIDAAISAIDTERSNLGSVQNRFTTTIANLQNGIENQSAAKSRIVDADFAQETANLSRGQILQQAGTAMLAQANQSGQGVLTLLR